MKKDKLNQELIKNLLSLYKSQRFLSDDIIKDEMKKLKIFTSSNPKLMWINFEFYLYINIFFFLLNHQNRRLSGLTFQTGPRLARKVFLLAQHFWMRMGFCKLSLFSGILYRSGILLKAAGLQTSQAFAGLRIKLLILFIRNLRVIVPILILRLSMSLNLGRVIAEWKGSRLWTRMDLIINFLPQDLI